MDFTFFASPVMPSQNSIVELGFVRLDPDRKPPLFRQLYDAVRTAILDGRLAAEARIPSSRDLMKQLGVSRTTVVTAIDLLIAEGYLQTIVGSGTFVSKEIPNDRPFVNTRPISPEETTSRTRAPLSSYLSEHGLQLSKNATRPAGHFGNLCAFRPGIPALDEFPVEVWSQLVRRTWRELSPSQLTYGDPSGLRSLRESVAEYLRAHRGVRCNTDQVFIVNGTQQAIDVTARLTLGQGDQVLFENPGYPNARDAFNSLGAETIPVPVDQNGADFEAAVSRYPNARLAYVTPSHQYPMGVTLSIDRRMELIRWAGENNGLILEDDYDSEYRYGQKPIPAMQGLDSQQRTVYVGSFSKVIFPALSLGYVIVPAQMIRAFEYAMSLVSRPSSLVDQYVLTDFIREGHFGRHLRRMRKTYSARRDVFVEEIHKQLPGKLEVIGGEAGLHCAVRYQGNLRDRTAALQLEAAGVITRPLSEYYAPGTALGKQINGLVIGFACANFDQIREAVRTMAAIL